MFLITRCAGETPREYANRLFERFEEMRLPAELEHKPFARGFKVEYGEHLFGYYEAPRG